MNLTTYIAAHNIVSPLGYTTLDNFEQLIAGQTGVRYHEMGQLSALPLFCAALDWDEVNTKFESLSDVHNFTKFEQLVVLSVSDALKMNPLVDVQSPRTLIILSTTKGNIELLAKGSDARFDKKRIYLWETARIIASHFDNPNVPVVVSNACISGVVAINVAKRLLEENKYDTVVVTGADVLSKFVVSGFESFKAISSNIAKPFDKDRDGISLGEGCGTLVLTNRLEQCPPGAPIEVMQGAVSNDANHISGPARDGEGLYIAIQRTLAANKLGAADIDYICGHGTATVYNDEMESIAITRAGLQGVPMNSLKSSFGHTMGAAGVIESIVAVESMRQNMLTGTYNFKTPGVSNPVNIIEKTREQTVDICLKTAAGFGGCNAAVAFKKHM